MLYIKKVHGLQPIQSFLRMTWWCEIHRLLFFHHHGYLTPRKPLDLAHLNETEFQAWWLECTNYDTLKTLSGKQESIWATGSIRQDGEFSVQSISCLWECASVCVWVRVLVGNQCARTLLTQITSFETKVNGRDQGLKPVWKSKVR